jgi:hypothetical protein
MGYFRRSELPEPMGLGVRTYIIDALDGTAGIVRIMPMTPASGRSLVSAPSGS